MVHNGIEYGDMQLIAEAYDILKTVADMSNDELAATFKQWNRCVHKYIFNLLHLTSSTTRTKFTLLLFRIIWNASRSTTVHCLNL
jgi:6-phosphogluconate dehydrogenase